MSKCWYCNNELTSGDNPKHFGICNKCYDEMFKSSDTIIRSFTNKISDLEAKLEEKQKENATLEAMLAENANDRKTIQEFKIGEDEYDLTDEDARNSLCWEVEELKQQLAEKEEYINTYFVSQTNQPIIQPTQHQDKISFAVEQLEKVKEKALHFYVNDTPKLTGFYIDVDEIDNQIKSLKGENK